MRIRLRKLMAGPDGVFPAGSVVEMPDVEAQRLIDTGQAEAVKGPIVIVVENAAPEVVTRETAVSVEAENREKRGSKARNRSNR